MSALDYQKLNDIYEKLNDLCSRVTKMETHLEHYFEGKKSNREKIAYVISGVSATVAVIALFVR